MNKFAILTNGGDTCALNALIKSGFLLEEWWNKIINSNGPYPCYGIYLALKSDKELTKYLKEYGSELHLISNKFCLIIALTSGWSYTSEFNEQLWKMAINQHILDGHSLKIAEVFGIKISQFPCFIIFEDLQSSRYVKISLIDMSADQINQIMREVFTCIQKAVRSNKNTISALQKLRKLNLIDKPFKSIVSGISTLAEKTFEKAIDATIKAIIK